MVNQLNDCDIAGRWIPDGGLWRGKSALAALRHRSTECIIAECIQRSDYNCASVRPCLRDRRQADLGTQTAQPQVVLQGGFGLSVDARIDAAQQARKGECKYASSRAKEQAQPIHTQQLLMALGLRSK